MSSLSWLIPELSNSEWLTHGSIFAINILLFLFAKPFLQTVEPDGASDSKVRLLRTLNICVLILQLIDIALLRANTDYENYFIKTGLSLMTLYASVLLYSIFSFVFRKRFGQERVLDDSTVFLETYSSRLIDILLLIFIVVAAIYTLIIIWGANSMLETTGIFGIFVAFLAFTSGIWAPDIISGLIILNSKILEDGDVVVIDGYPDEYIINKVSFIYVILFDVRNNHRTLIRNNRFIQSKIDNISRIASTEGIRKNLVYQIGYPQFSQSSAAERSEALEKFGNKIGKMFDRAFQSCCEDNVIKINHNKPFEWAITHTGNYALEYTMWFYLERIPNTKITATIRKHLMGTIYRVNEAVYRASVAEGVDLSTPDISHIQLRSESEPVQQPLPAQSQPVTAKN